MKNRIKDKLNIETIFSLVIVAVCVLAFIRDFPFCRSLIEKTAVISANTVLVKASRKNEGNEPEVNWSEEQTSEIEETSAHTEKQTEEETQPSSEKETKNENTTVKANSLIDDDFTAEPGDIRKLIEKYSEKAKDDKKDGAITELKYTTSGVTDSYKNVRVKNVNETKINIEKLLSEKPDINIKDKSQPTVLIFHTHTTESYQILDRSFYARGYVTRSENSSRNMIRVGDEICSQLEKAGFSVIHDTKIYDKQYNGAYDRSRVSVREYLDKYPSIQVVLDIHRDAIEYNDGTKVKPVAEISGKKSAQMMIITGCQEEGNGIGGFEDWRYNLVFALHLQKKLEDMFPGITRPVYFCPRRYIMNESHCNLLVEVGSDANTLSEGVYAGKCLGTALASLLEDYI